jgi:hypothetical protein
MTESVPPTLEQTRQLHRSLTQKVLDKAQSDPQWKQQLIDDPEAAMQAAGFPEIQQLGQMQASAWPQQGEEVRGQSGSWEPPWGGGGGPWGGWCPWQCSWWTYYWYRSWGGGW